MWGRSRWLMRIVLRLGKLGVSMVELEVSDVSWEELSWRMGVQGGMERGDIPNAESAALTRTCETRILKIYTDNFYNGSRIQSLAVSVTGLRDMSLFVPPPHPDVDPITTRRYLITKPRK